MDYKIVVFVPDAHLEPVKQALFTAGAGRFDRYDQCSWQVWGQGQFRPIGAANPHTGQLDKLTVASEWRLELVVTQTCLKAAVAAMLKAHPYEEVAFEVYELVDRQQFLNIEV